MIITYLPHAKFSRQFAMAHHQKKWESYLTEIKGAILGVLQAISANLKKSMPTAISAPSAVRSISTLMQTFS